MSGQPEVLRLADKLDRSWYDVEMMRAIKKGAAELRRQHAENERLRALLALVLNSHGKLLLTDPPQEAWKFNRVEEKIREVLRDPPR